MQNPAAPLTRREMLRTSALGFGSLALSYLLNREEARGSEAGHDLKPRAPHARAQAKAVIMLMQNGGPSQMDLFDPKPELKKREGQVYDERVEMFQKGSEANKLLGTPFKFMPRGQCGMELSEVIPHLGSVADDVCLVRSMYSEHNNHTEALVLMNTGKIFPGRPALGSWVSYGLGTENENLPAYIVLRDPEGYNTSAPCCGRTAGCRALSRHGGQHAGAPVPLTRLDQCPPRCAATAGPPGDAEQNPARRTRRKAIWRHGSAPTNWQRACSLPRASSSVSSASRPPRNGSMASTTRRRRAMACVA